VAATELAISAAVHKTTVVDSTPVVLLNRPRVS